MRGHYSLTFPAPRPLPLLHARVQRTKAGVTSFTQWVDSCSSSLCFASLSSICMKAPNTSWAVGVTQTRLMLSTRLHAIMGNLAASLKMLCDAEERYSPSSRSGDPEKTQLAISDTSALGAARRTLRTFGWDHVAPLFQTRKMTWSTSLLTAVWGALFFSSVFSNAQHFPQLSSG